MHLQIGQSVMYLVSLERSRKKQENGARLMLISCVLFELFKFQLIIHFHVIHPDLIPEYSLLFQCENMQLLGIFFSHIYHFLRQGIRNGT